MIIKRLLADALIAAALITAVAVARTVETRNANEEARAANVTRSATGAALMPRADRFACVHGIQPGCKRPERWPDQEENFFGGGSAQTRTTGRVANPAGH